MLLPAQRSHFRMVLFKPAAVMAAGGVAMVDHQLHVAEAIERQRHVEARIVAPRRRPFLVEAPGLGPAWELTVQAVCARPLGGPHVDAEGATGDDPRTARTVCPAAFFVHGAMGGSSRAGFTDAGFTWLKMIFPTSALKSTIVQMTGSHAGGPVAWATCATGG